MKRTEAQVRQYVEEEIQLMLENGELNEISWQDVKRRATAGAQSAQRGYQTARGAAERAATWAGRKPARYRARMQGLKGRAMGDQAAIRDWLASKISGAPTGQTPAGRAAAASRHIAQLRKAISILESKLTSLTEVGDSLNEDIEVLGLDTIDGVNNALATIDDATGVLHAVLEDLDAQLEASLTPRARPTDRDQQRRLPTPAPGQGLGTSSTPENDEFNWGATG